MSDEDHSVMSILEEKNMMSILVYLRMAGVSRKMDIYRNVSNNPRIPDKLDRLESLGLITQADDRNSRAVLISLTEKGEQVAGLLTDIEDLLCKSKGSE